MNGDASIEAAMKPLVNIGQTQVSARYVSMSRYNLGNLRALRVEENPELLSFLRVRSLPNHVDMVVPSNPPGKSLLRSTSDGWISGFAE